MTVGDVYVRFALVCKETRTSLVLKFSVLTKSKTHIGDVYVRFALVCKETRIGLILKCCILPFVGPRPLLGLLYQFT